MITKEDISGYLNNMLRFEMGVESNYKELLEEIKDQRIRKELAALASDEGGHVQKIGNLLKLFEDD